MKFRIKEGKHKASGLNFGFTLKRTISFEGMFFMSCIHQIEGNDKYDINKFFGLSDSYNHMVDSIRLGWNCSNGQDIGLFLFAHVNGKYVYEYLTHVKANQLFECVITILNNQYMVSIRDDKYVYTKTVKRTSNWFGIRYLLFPYFGGNQVSPKDMKLMVKPKPDDKLFMFNFNNQKH